MSKSDFVADGSVVFVTGASRGIGRAIASLLGRHGFRVFGNSRAARACSPAEPSLIVRRLGLVH